MSTTIKFGTDGWRAIIGDEFTTRNVARVSNAVSAWLNKRIKNKKPRVIIGHDCRFNGKLFQKIAIQEFLANDIEVYMAEDFVSTPMVSLAARNYNCDLGVVITASHNPPEYNGYKLKAKYGGPLAPELVQEIEDLIPSDLSRNYVSFNVEEAIKNRLVKNIDIEKDYLDQIQKSFDLPSIKNSTLKLAYDAMYGAGQNVLKAILPKVNFLHCESNPSFMGQAPEPIEKNLLELKNFIINRTDIDCALATDGDADRIGLFDGAGNFIDSHHIILLLVHYMVKYRGLKGKVVTAFSCTPRIKKICEYYGLEHETVKIGFKYVAGKMVEEDVLLGGEESGGIAVKGHIPERDGIWMGLIIWEFLAKSGKTIDELISEVYEIVGEFKFERSDLHITENLKQEIIQNCNRNAYTQFGDYQVERVETIDGFKFFFKDGKWVMIRPSGTEPVLRIYAEGKNLIEVRDILLQTKKTIC